MKKYFENIRNKKELVREFRKIAKRIHPDAGGNAEEFKAMKKEFDRLITILPDDSKEESIKTEKQKTKIFPELSATLENVIHIEGIEIEICGTWIWISGNTYPVKELIKEAGFKFSRNKKMWYWHNGEYKRHSKKNMSIEEIRALHGSQEVQTTERIAIA